MVRRTTRQHLVGGWAQCNHAGCGAEVDAKNAQAWAHNHARTHGHRVHLMLEYGVNPTDELQPTEDDQ